MNLEYWYKLLREKNLKGTNISGVAKLVGEGINKYLTFNNKVYFYYSPTLKNEDLLLTEKEFDKLFNMRYAVKQNSTQEICDWFRKYNRTDNASLIGEWKYLVYDSISKKTEFDYFLNRNTIELSAEEFTKKFIKKEIKNMRTITYQQAQEIIDIACNGWKDKLFKVWGQFIVYKKDVDIEEDFYKEMREACTPEQHKLFDKIFGKNNIPESGTLVYVKDFDTDKIWDMRYYARYSNGKHYCFADQKKEGLELVWKIVSLTNPLIESPQYI